MSSLTLHPPPSDPLGIVGQLDLADERALSIVRGLTDDQGSWRPHPSDDSVALSLARYLAWLRCLVPVLRDAVHGVRSTWRARLGDVRSGWWWRVIPQIAGAVPIVRLVEGDVLRECARRPVRDLMGEILVLHGEVRRFAREGAVRDLRTARVPLPRVPVLRPPIDVALALVPAMARRHLRRAERVRLHAGFPRA